MGARRSSAVVASASPAVHRRRVTADAQTAAELTPALAEAREAFARGDFRRAGELARAVIAAPPDDAARAEAVAVLARLSPDRFAVGLVVAAAVGVAVIGALTLGR